jgi:vacuolar-type H+-ATPase subunit E/Vma4
MSLEHILESLAAKGQAEIARIEDEAEEQARIILEQAEAEAIRIREQHMAAIRPRIESERTRRINAARLTAQRIQLEARKALIDAAFDATSEELACLRGSLMYPALLAALIDEVFDELGTNARLVVDPRDASLAHALLDRQEINADPSTPLRAGIEPVLDTWGGVMGHSADDRLTVDNRLETRLEQVRRRFRGEVAAVFEATTGNAG